MKVEKRKKLFHSIFTLIIITSLLFAFIPISTETTEAQFDHGDTFLWSMYDGSSDELEHDELYNILSVFMVTEYSASEVEDVDIDISGDINDYGFYETTQEGSYELWVDIYFQDEDSSDGEIEWEVALDQGSEDCPQIVSGEDQIFYQFVYEYDSQDSQYFLRNYYPLNHYHDEVMDSRDYAIIGGTEVDYVESEMDSREEMIHFIYDEFGYYEMMLKEEDEEGDSQWILLEWYHPDGSYGGDVSPPNDGIGIPGDADEVIEAVSNNVIPVILIGGGLFIMLIAGDDQLMLIISVSLIGLGFLDVLWMSII